MNKYVIFPGNNAKPLLQPLLEKRGNWSEHDSSDFKCHFIFKPDQFSLKVTKIQELSLFTIQKYPNSVYNHLSCHKELTTKTGLLKNLRDYYSVNDSALNSNYQAFDTMPTSFLLTGQVEDSEHQNFINRFNEISIMRSNKERLPIKHCMKNIWIIKPAALNQGKGIEICRNLNVILKKMRDKPNGSLWVVQKYIEKPLLIAGRKFDIRVWALATGKRDLFYYKLGYVRTSSFEYDLEGKDTYIHLTNNCLQQYSDMYGAYEEGNTLSWDQLDLYLKEMFPQYNLNFSQHFAPRIKDLVIDSYLSCKKVIQKGKNKGVFELLGYDFLIDEDFRVWLLEVNTNPYLGEPNEYISKILPSMLDDMLALTVDVAFEPSQKYEVKENLFELIYCESGSVFSSKSLNKRQPFGTSFYPIPELAQKPLCRQCVAYKYDEEGKGSIFKDFLQLCKNLLKIEGSVVAEEYSDYMQKLTMCMKNWKNQPIDQNINCFNAFTYFFCYSRQGFYCEQDSLKLILRLFQDFNMPENVKILVINSISEICKTLVLKKFLVNNGLVACFVDNLLVDNSENVRKMCRKLLIQVSENPDRKIYVPGKSIEMKTIRESLLAQGGLVALVHLAQTKENFCKKLNSLLTTHFSLDELTKQVNIIKDNINQFGEFPRSLLSLDLKIIKSHLQNLINSKTEENLMKQQQAKKLREEQDRKLAEQEELIKQKQEEKKEKMKNYLKKKTLELKRHKSELERSAKLEKDIEARNFNDRKSAFLLKQSQKPLFQKKKFPEDKDLKLLEQAREKLYKKNKKKLIRDWSVFKKDMEKKIGKNKLMSKLARQVSKALNSYNVKRSSFCESYEKLPFFCGSGKQNFHSTIQFPMPKYVQEPVKRIDLLSKTLNKSEYK